MTVNMDAAAFAESEMPSIQENMKYSYDAVFSYAQKILPGHLSMFDYDSAHVEISNVYPLNSLQNTGEGLYLCFALENGRIIGELTVAELPDGEFTSTFDLCSYPEVDEAVAKGEPIGFYSDDGALYFMTNHSLTIIDRDAISESQPEIIARQANKVSLTKMENKPIPCAYDVYEFLLLPIRFINVNMRLKLSKIPQTRIITTEMVYVGLPVLQAKFGMRLSAISIRN